MEILLDKKIHVNQIGPELLSINRESLNLHLNLTHLNQITLEEAAEIENRISAKLSAKMSNLTSPVNRVTPKSNRSIKLPKSGSLEKLAATAQNITASSPT